MEVEEWKDIDGFKSLYQISNLGNVKSLDRRVVCSGGYVRNVKGRVLKKTLSTSGYYSVFLSKCGMPRIKTVHQMVAIHFLNHKPNKFNIVVNHIDGDRVNNKASNLELIPHRDNVSLGFKNKSSKYTGVCWHKTHLKWMASIQIRGVNKHLGYFNNEVDAHEKYLNEKKNA